MKSKKSVLILLGSFLIATVVLLAVLFFMLQSGTLSKRTAAIALPSDGGFVEAWTQHLPQIARIVGIPEVTILTYGNYDKLKNYFLNRGFTCELLSNSGSKCVSNNNGIKTTFYRYESGFEYSVKTESYSLYMVHRLDKEDKIEFVTTSEAFTGYKNQKFTCTYEKNVLGKVEKCEAADETTVLDVKSYLGVIEHAQAEVTNAINASGFSLDSVLINYEWLKK